MEVLGGEVLEAAMKQGVGGECEVGVGELGEALMTICSLEDGDFE